MNYGLIQLAKARNEIIKTWEWYEDKQPGLGDRFIIDIERKISAIILNPFHYPKKGK